MDLAQELLTNVQYSGGSRSFAKERRALKTRSVVAGCWKLTMTKWEQSPQLILLQLHAAAAKSLQSCPTLCNPTDGSPPGSLVPGILQARTLEWVVISFSNAWKWKVKVKSFSCVRPLTTPWTAAYQAPPPMGFSRQEYWSELSLPSQYNYMRHCQRTQRRPFYCHWHWSKLERWKNSITQHLMSWLQIKKPAVIFSYSTQQQWTISPSNCDVWQKVDFIWQLAVTSSVAGLRRNFKALPKAKFALKKGHGHWWSAAHLNHNSFLNPGKTITFEKCAQQINEMHWKMQCVQ